MQNLFIINSFEHIESKNSVDSIIYNQYKIFVIFVRIFHDEKSISNETHSEQWARINSILSKIENINIDKKNASHSIANWCILNLTNIQFVLRACNKLLLNLTNIQYVWRTRNESRACNKVCNRTRNFLIILFISYRKMINNIENILDWISRLRFHQIANFFYFYRIWNRIRKYVIQASKTILSNFSILSFHSRTSIYYLIRNRSTKTLYQRLIARRRFHIYTDHKNATYNRFHIKQMTSMSDVETLWIIWSLSLDENSQSKLYKSYVARAMNFAITCFHTIETCDMQQISFETKYNHHTTLK